MEIRLGGRFCQCGHQCLPDRDIDLRHRGGLYLLLDLLRSDVGHLCHSDYHQARSLTGFSMAHLAPEYRADNRHCGGRAAAKLQWSIRSGGADPEKPYLKALALHLQKSGARFYGAYWCQNCQEQKSLFEASAHRLPYVESPPNGQGGIRNVDCLTRNIQRYPTWITNDRRYKLALEPESLARYSKFRWTEGK